MKIAFVAILCVIFFLTEPESMGYSASSGILTHFLYPFSHANLLHLAVNAFVFFRLSAACENLSCLPRENSVFPIFLLSLAILTSVVASFSTLPSKPVVGFSGALFAYAGYGISVMAFSANYRTRAFITLSVMLIWQDIFLYFTNIYAPIHVSCMLLSFTLTNIYYYGRGFHKN